MHLGFVEMFGKLKCWKMFVYCRNSCSWNVNFVNRRIVNKFVSLVAVGEDGEKDKRVGKIKKCKGNKQFGILNICRKLESLDIFVVCHKYLFELHN